MAKKIAFANNKGGVGKTTMSIYLSDALKHQGKKVLFIDLDPQHNATNSFGATIVPGKTILNVLKGEITAEDAIVETVMGDIIPGDFELNKNTYFFQNQPGSDFFLKTTLKKLDKLYDFIIMDTPPSLGVYLSNALAFADGCIIPVKAEQYAFDGISGLLEEVTQSQIRVNDNLRIYGLVLNAYDMRTRIGKDTKENLEDLAKQIEIHAFETSISVCQDIQNAQAEEEGKEGLSHSLFERYPKSKAVIDYKNFTKELLEEV